MGVSVPVILRKPIAPYDFAGGPDPCPPLDPRMHLSKDQMKQFIKFDSYIICAMSCFISLHNAVILMILSSFVAFFIYFFFKIIFQAHYQDRTLYQG